MQKELKIGIAIGAVLLVVLIVYLAVPKDGGTDVAQSDDVTLTGEQTPAGDTPAPPAGDSTGTPTSTDRIATTPPGEEVFATRVDTADPPKPEGDGGDIWFTALNTGELPVTTTPPPLLAVPKKLGETATTPPTGQDTEATTAEPKPTGTETTTGSDIVIETTRKNGATPQPGIVDEPARPEPVTTGGARTHKVQRGETFSSIAKAVYGEERFYISIQNANPTLDASRLRPGTVINLPDVTAVKGTGSSSPTSPTGGSSEKAIDSETEYRVESGDSLYKISMKRFGTPSLTEEIYELNKQTIGADSSRLKVGTVLKMPAKPASDSNASR